MNAIPAEVLTAFQVLNRYNIKDGEAALKKAVGIAEPQNNQDFFQFRVNEQDVPELFEEYYNKLLSFLDAQIDSYRVELSGLLYPIFVQMYLRLVSSNRLAEAKSFFEAFKYFQESYYQEDLTNLSTIDSVEHLRSNPMLSNFKACNFFVSVPKECYDALKQFLAEKKLHTIQSVLRDQLTVEVFEGPPRSRAQIDCRRGALFGEVAKDINKEQIFYGAFRSADAPKELENAEFFDDDGDDAPAKKKKRREILGVGKPGLLGKKTDGNAPPEDRIPLPNLSSTYLEARQSLTRELNMLFKSNPNPVRSRGVSSVLYTVCNAQTGESALSIRKGGVHCMSFDNTASVMGAGFASGRVRIWSLGAESLRQLMDPQRLSQLDKDDAWVKTKMLYDENDEAHPTRDLIGHQDSVNGLSFCPNKQFILTVSSDGSVRLWSRLLWSGALALWRDHLLPVWALSWAPAYGHYFATGGADRTARLYAIDHAPNALRVFTGHKSDVTSVAFHPNINYLATGSADRCVRLYDVKTAKAVRIFTGHKGSIQSLAFSPCGRYLASGGWCGSICLWDLAQGGLIGQLGGYCTSSDEDLDNQDINSQADSNKNGDSSSAKKLLTGPVVSLEFCPSHSGVLAAGGLEGALRLWNTGTGQSNVMSMQGASGNLLGIQREMNSVPLSSLQPYPMVALGDSVSKTCLQDSYYTRKTAVLALKFIHPRLILCAGPYSQT